VSVSVSSVEGLLGKEELGRGKRSFDMIHEVTIITSKDFSSAREMGFMHTAVTFTKKNDNRRKTYPHNQFNVQLRAE